MGNDKVLSEISEHNRDLFERIVKERYGADCERYSNGDVSMFHLPSGRSVSICVTDCTDGATAMLFSLGSRTDNRILTQAPCMWTGRLTEESANRLFDWMEASDRLISCDMKESRWSVFND